MNDKKTPDWDPRSEDVLRDQRMAYDQMREHCPVAHSELMGWSLFRHEDITRALHDHETFSNAVSEHLSVPNGMDPPEHTIYRRLIETYFVPERMDAFEPLCREIVLTLVRSALARGEVELINDFAQPFAVRVQCAFLGWPTALHEPLIRWIINKHEATLAQNRQALAELAREFEEFIDVTLETCRHAGAKSDSNVTSALIQDTVGGQPLRREEIASILRNWTVGEIGTISAAVGLLVHYLALHTELQMQLRAEPDILPTAIDEILRIHAPLVANRRITTHPVKIGGRELGTGERISLNWMAANRDGRVFEAPDTFRLDRDPSKNLLYGAGIHACPGAPLARMELRVVIEELLKHSTSIELVADQSPTNSRYPASGFCTLPLKIQ
ncbi:cytochrome P450 [Methylomarinum sp. Ch1-1]|uniref:Cytochrome P450 n=1 Tax=Methylomarinum roseum TaxID=3067653 RepID=A0AAU7NX39_9GAMM|nr:cytochrome P450 [Methylomarinum sp. Ch1-1]MDP4522366.1 cytochrome P450 [Methylomarinum sp. Ch1-1]